MTGTGESKGDESNVGRQAMVIFSLERSSSVHAVESDASSTLNAGVLPSPINAALETAAAIAANVPPSALTPPVGPPAATTTVSHRGDVTSLPGLQPAQASQERNIHHFQPIAPTPAVVPNTLTHIQAHQISQPPQQQPLLPIAAPPSSNVMNKMLPQTQHHLPLHMGPQVVPIMTSHPSTVVAAVAPPGVVLPVLSAGSTTVPAASSIPIHVLRKRRSGKWTREEEAYASILIDLFDKGQVEEKNGVTLRSFLSRKLFCAPMRISKKYAGKGIGKKVFMNKHNAHVFAASCGYTTVPPPPLARTPEYYDDIRRLRLAELKFMHAAFPEMAGVLATSHMLQSDIPTVGGAVTRFSPLLTAPLQAQMVMPVAVSTHAAPALLHNTVESEAQQPSLFGATNAMVSTTGPFQTLHQPILQPGPLPGMVVPGLITTPAISDLPTSVASQQHQTSTNILPNGTIGATALPLAPKSFNIPTNNATLATNTIHETTLATLNSSPSPAPTHTPDESTHRSISYQTQLAQQLQYQQMQPLVQTAHSFSPVTTHYFVAHNAPLNTCATSVSKAIVPSESANSSRPQQQATTRVAHKEVLHHATKSHSPAMSGPIQQLHEAYLKTFSTAPAKDAPTGVASSPSEIGAVSSDGFSWRPDEENLVSTTAATSASPQSRMCRPSNKVETASNVPTAASTTMEGQRLQNALVPPPALRNALVAPRALYNGNSQPGENVVHNSTLVPPSCPVARRGIATLSEMPDFLSGFDKVVTKNQDTVTNACINMTEMLQDTPCSPNFTSKSFDDLHCFLGQGLSPVSTLPLPAAQGGSGTTAHSSSFRKRQFHDVTARAMSPQPVMSNMDKSLRRKDGTAMSDQLEVTSMALRENKATEPPMLDRNFRGLPDMAYLIPRPVENTGPAMRLLPPHPATGRGTVDPPVRVNNWSLPENGILEEINSASTKAKEHEQNERDYRRQQQDSSNDGSYLNGMYTFHSPPPYHTMGIFTSSGRVATVSEPSNASDTTSDDANSGNEGGDSDGTQSVESFRGMKYARLSTSNIEEIQEWVRQS